MPVLSLRPPPRTAWPTPSLAPASRRVCPGPRYTSEPQGSGPRPNQERQHLVWHSGRRGYSRQLLGEHRAEPWPESDFTSSGPTRRATSAEFGQAPAQIGPASTSWPGAGPNWPRVDGTVADLNLGRCRPYSEGEGRPRRWPHSAPTCSVCACRSARDLGELSQGSAPPVRGAARAGEPLGVLGAEGVSDRTAQSGRRLGYASVGVGGSPL